MESNELLGEIQDTNLSYLMLAQRLLREDFATAQFRLKLDNDMAGMLMSLSTKQLGRLARTNQFQFRMCLDSVEQVKQVLDKRPDSTMMQTHAALLMSGAGSEI